MNPAVTVPVGLRQVCAVFQDEVRLQRASKRSGTLEEVNNSVKLLNEMLSHFSRDQSTDGDKELIKVGPHLTSLSLL